MDLTKTLYRLSCVLAFILLLNCTGNEQAAGNLSREFLSKIMVGDISEAAAILHYPENLPRSERIAETVNMAAKLNIIIQILGLPRESRVVTKMPALHSVYLHSITEQYWEWFPVIGTVAFHVNYINAGSGYIILSFAEVEDTLVIKKVQFSLPMENSNSKTIIMNIAHKILRDRQAPLQIEKRKNNLST